jgi:hypothetical protein
MMTPRRSASRSVIGYSLGFLGVLIVVATLSFHFWLHINRPDQGHEFLYFPTIAGAVLGWWGFFWADSKRARDGGDFLVSARERWMRAGRRETDSVAVVAEPTAPHDIVMPPNSPELPPRGGE